ncbi:AI-2E family transporter [Skermanella rosea]|uniref:AI-2E family transporter n=1 Tax=Skermanella rosea TaxID=1817965 RepID=UPI0019348D28|nr:AI-2E family transporter [Skermanella rosea]UEM05259.1 AI-2E family transporter [Skermanella rosea]
MSRRRQRRFWLIAALVAFAALYVLRDMLLPFVAGMAIAYFLDPVADRLEQMGTPRWLATTGVLLFFLLCLVLALLLLVPLIQSQVVQLVETLPRIVAWVNNTAIPTVEGLLTQLSPEDLERLRTAVGSYAGEVVGWLAAVLRSIVTGGVALFDVLTLLFITPIVAFYLLRDWDVMIGTIHGWLPRQHAATILDQVNEIDRTLAGFVRGQATVCLVLGLFYGVALSVFGLNFGLVVGSVAGLLSFIPYVGSLVGFVSSVGIALVQYDTWTPVVVVVAIFLVGQAVEGNFLTPKLVGDKVGLHPVWVMFALLAGGSLFGFVGVLMAVPVAAVIGVLTRFALQQYLSSSYYSGPDSGAADEAWRP